MISDLPRDLAEEVLVKLPVTSLRGARSTCKKWNTLTKDESFTKKHISEAAKKKQKKKFQVVMMLEYKVYLMSVDLLYDNPSIERIGKLVSLGDDADISKIFHCDGLFLCITNDNHNNSRSRVVVWNPYNGQTRWIKPRNSYHDLDRYALGYDKKENNLLRNHKVLRLMDYYDGSIKRRIREFEIYSLNSDSWKVVHLTHESRVFGPRLPLPVRSRPGDTVALSSVRENQLAVLFQQWDTLKMKIWISDKIEHDAVSWGKCFLAVDMKPLIGIHFHRNSASFLVDEEMNVAVVLDLDGGRSCPTRNTAYFINENGCFKKVDLGGSANKDCWPLVCSYVPSSVQIKQASPPRKRKNY
ncbi:unnamed protein product [Microthlaspi erraticum]|uniref:F-box domain-containing protein n=1 Tax=Microthlaspi erraticum TaxID=1685480 RepID=A0A6D2HIB8_9BRAS|nr:unnamed protein product [Microthlaspi erraticum]